MRKLLFLLLLIPVISFAQGTTTQIRRGSTLPATCGGGDIFIKSGTSAGFYFNIASGMCSWIGPPSTLNTSSDVVALFTGCSGSDNLGADGACHSASGSGTVTHSAGGLTVNQLVIGNDAEDLKVLGSLGTTTTVLHGNASGAPSFGSVATGDIAANAVTSAKLAVVNTRRTCMLPIGDGTNTVVSGDYSPFNVGRCYIPYAATIVEVLLQCDAGTPSIQFEKRHGASTVTDLLSAALAANGTTKTCALTSTSGTCIDGTTSSGSITISTTSVAAGDYLEVKSGTASTEKRCDASITFTVD
jgi:hypothetical protein